MNRLRVSIIGGAVLVAVLFLYPFELDVSPPWRIHAIDANGQWHAGCEVSQTWQWVGLESDPHHDAAVTDRTGVADFQRRTIRASLLRRALVKSGCFSFHGVRCGPTVWFLACGPGQGPGQLLVGIDGGRMDYGFKVEPLPKH